MTENAINAKSEALELHELSEEQLDAVSGGWFCTFVFLGSNGETDGGQNDPAQMFQQIMQQMTAG
jgi:bacteriocin-like protein